MFKPPLIVINEISLDQRLLNFCKDLEPAHPEAVLIKQILILPQKVYELFCTFLYHYSALVGLLNLHIHLVLFAQIVHLFQWVLLPSKL